MAKVYQIHCPECNNIHSFIVTAKINQVPKNISAGNAAINLPPDALTGKPGKPRQRLYPSCPVCGKATFLRHDKEHYSNYRCCDKKCNHFLFVPKPAAVSAPSMSKRFGKTDFKRMRFPVHVLLLALTLFYLGKNSFRNIALILRTVMNIQVSHTTISNWCTNFAPCSKTLPYRPFRRSILTPASGTLTKPW